MEQDGEAADWAAEAERLAAEFFDALQRMYIRAGEPPLRTVAARSDRLSASNLSALFSGRRTTLPNYEVMTAAVSALLHEAPAAEKQRELERWRDRWTEAKYARRQAQKPSAQNVDELSQAAARGVEQARLEAEAIVAEARATAEDLLKRGRMDADAAAVMHAEAASRRAEADETLSDARSHAELILADARSLKSAAEVITAAAEFEAERIRAEAREEAEAIEVDALLRHPPMKARLEP